MFRTAQLATALTAAALSTSPVGLSERADGTGGSAADVVAAPMVFEANRGQADSAIRFVSRGPGYTLSLLEREAVLALEGPDALRSVHIRPAGAEPPRRIVGIRRTAGLVHYFRGNDPGEWHTDVPVFGGVRYEEIYPGIDLEFYGNPRLLEFDFIVAPGADPEKIRLEFPGAEEAAIEPPGDLVLRVGGERIRLERPSVFQSGADRTRPVAGEYVRTEEGRFGFRIGSYDRSKPLVIDPVVRYATYLGGGGFDTARGGIAVDADGHVYVTGFTRGAPFPVANAVQPFPGGSSGFITDAYITKFSPDGQTLVYSTYIGGSDRDFGWGIAVDANGNA